MATASCLGRKAANSKVLVATAIVLNIVFSWYLVMTLRLGSPSLLIGLDGESHNDAYPGEQRPSFTTLALGGGDDHRPPPRANTCATTTSTILPFPAHGCHLSNHWSTLTLCQFENLVLDTAKLSAKVHGGEPLQDVMGQEEKDEYLTYDVGAFTVSKPPLMNWTTGSSRNSGVPTHHHYIQSVLDALVTTTAAAAADTTNQDFSTCGEVWSGTTLFITRYEYVNLFHTMTDWWNAYFTMASSSLPVVNVVFLDAHPRGNLDPVWQRLFRGKVAFARHLPPGRVCFDVARLVPAGYDCPLYHKPAAKQHDDDDYTRDITATKCFVDFFLQALDVDHVQRIPGKVVVLDRVPYVAHPRSDVSNAPRLLSNLNELTKSLQQLDHVPNIDKLTVQVATLVSDTMSQQIQHIREADVLVANHGAGLTHLLFLDDGATAIEFSPKIPLFSILSKWKPAINFIRGDMVQGNIRRDQWDRVVVPAVTLALSKA